ncbi:MAG: dihydrolipoamide acetyltransferase family protein [Candidatus Bathyarchaeia archaeon]
MATKVIMTKLGLTMKDGTVVNWLKEEGEPVQKGEPLVEVETEKISTELEAPASGVLLKITAKKGTIVPVSGLLGIIGEPNEDVSSIENTEAEPEISAAAPETEKILKQSEVEVSPEKVRISPLARKIADEHKIDLTKITGTGPDGRIVKEDVLKALGNTETVGQPTASLSKEGVEVAEVIPLVSMRKTIAERLFQSYSSAVHTTVIAEIDMTEASKFRQELTAKVKEETGISLTYTSIIVKAAALALREHKMVNSTLEDQEIKILKNINVGVAVDIEEGLIVPVIRDADRKSLSEIALLLSKLGEKARNRTLSMEEVAGGTFTVTNLGMLGVHTFIPIINPPQAAILGVGAIEDRPVIVEGNIVARSRLNLSLVYDHRIINGAGAARFLQTMKRILEAPSTLNG